MTPTAEYERWAYGEGWTAGLLEGRRQGFDEGYGPGFDAGAEIGAERVLLAIQHATGDVLADLIPDLPHIAGYLSHRERAAPNDEPCPYGCRACSRCIRAAAARRNLAQHGQPDYPGGRSVQKGRS